MFENASLQEAYTGSLIAGKGRDLNNIKAIMTQSKFRVEEWTRVRFGAGTPWRRCWCVITPPDEKEVQKAQKSMKKRSAYDRHTVVLKGDVKFYDTKKIKKATPIATITDAYAAYAIYPQSKPLIEQSTLIKIEGRITIHSRPETKLESFVFVMPEVRPAVSGFEMLLRFLFPIWDVFALYGRPNKLIPDTLDTRSLMFAMPKGDRYGYLEILDVAGLVHTPGSPTWREAEWKRELKQLVSQRISKMSRQQSQASRIGSAHGHAHRNSLPSRSGTLRFEDQNSMRSTPSLHDHSEFKPQPPPHTDSAPPGAGPFAPPRPSVEHTRSISSEMKPAPPVHRRPRNFTDTAAYMPSRLSHDTGRPRDSFDEEPEGIEENAPPPPAHALPAGTPQMPGHVSRTSSDGLQYRSSSESERRFQQQAPANGQSGQGAIPAKPPSPVAAPPVFSREPGAKPSKRPYHSPELRRANSRMSSATLSQLAAASKVGADGSAVAGGASVAGAAAAAAMASAARGDGRRSEDQNHRGVIDDTGRIELPADHEFRNQGLALDNAGIAQSNSPPSRPQLDTTSAGSQGSGVNLRAPSKSYTRSVSPLSQVSTLSPIQPKTPINADSYFQSPSEVGSVGRSPELSSISPITPELKSSRPTSSGRITRKPVPSPAKETFPIASTALSDEDYRIQDVEDGLNRMDTVNSRATDTSTHYSEDDSHYDTDSVASPNYDTPDASVSERALPMQADRPRTGKLKTVGTVDPADQEVVIGDVRYKPEDNQLPGSELSSIDFGPTQLYNLGPQPAHGRSKSAERLGYEGGNASSDNLLHGGRGGITPSHVIDAYNRSPSRSALPTPENEPADNRRSMLWQPGTAVGTGRQSPGPSITPEQYVQQRAAANRVPAYAHQRQGSGTPPRAHSRQDSQTPPLTARPTSGDWSGAPRPGSRNAGTVMNQPQDYSQHLSAREQEHVARMTNSPLINLAGSSHQRSQSQGGLVGAIQAREEEKRAMKEGHGGYMVQQAIAQRHQQAQAQSPRSPVQHFHYPQSSPHMQNFNYSHPSPQMHIPGQFPITPQVDSAGWEYMQQQGHQAQYGQPQYAQSQYGYHDQNQYSPRQAQQGVYYQQGHPQQGQYQDGYYGGR